MGEHIKKTGNEVVGRWQQKMPRFFQHIVVICACVVLSAFVVNTAMTVAGAVPHEWWNNVYPLLIGVPTGMIVVCKLTVAGGYKDIDVDALSYGRPDHAQSHRSHEASYDDSDVVVEHPDE